MKQIKEKADVLVLTYDEGKRILIKKSAISAIQGDSESTTFYFNGNRFSVDVPLDEMLIAVGSEYSA